MSSAPFALFPRVIRAPVFGGAYSGAPTLFHADLYGILRNRRQLYQHSDSRILYFGSIREDQHWCYSRYCLIRDLPASVLQKFSKVSRSPEYLTISFERQRKFARVLRAGKYPNTSRFIALLAQAYGFYHRASFDEQPWRRVSFARGRLVIPMHPGVIVTSLMIAFGGSSTTLSLS